MANATSFGRMKKLTAFLETEKATRNASNDVHDQAMTKA
jgi:hypothetical protein